MTSPKFNALLTLVAVALIGFFLIESGISLGKKPDKVTETKVEQAPQKGEVKPNTIKLQDKVWFGKINKGETKFLELNLLFPDEGKFFIEATALAYDKEIENWKTLGLYYIYVTTKKREEGKIEKTRSRPRVPPYKIKAEGPIISNWYETAKRDIPLDDSVGVKPKAIHSHRRPVPLPVSMQLGEAPLELLISFEPNPKINEPTKLVLNISSTVPRDSVVVYLLYAGNIKVIK